MTTRIKLRRDTAANWLAANPILSAGEPGLETDTGKIKYGDGVTAWETLPHAGSDSLTSETAINVQTGDAQRWLTRLRREDDDGTGTGTGVFVNNVYYDNEGNVIVTALVNLNDDGTTIFKFTSAGDLVWKYVLDGYNSNNDSQGGLAVDSNNDIWMTIYPSNPATGLIKLSGVDGTILYASTFWNDEEGGSESYAIAVDSNDDVLLVGDVGYVGTGPKIALMKLVGTGNNIGNISWQVQVNPDGDFAQGFGLAVDSDDNVIVTGTQNNGDGIDKMYIMSFDSTGGINWQKSLELNADDSGAGSSVAVDSAGNIYVTGTLLVKNPDVNYGPGGNAYKSNAIIIACLDNIGEVVWARRIGPGACSWVGAGITVGDDGDLYLVASTIQPIMNDQNNSDIGYYDPSIILARYNAQNGKVVWQRYWNNAHAQDVPAGPIDTNGGPTFDGPNWAGHAIDVYKDKIVIGGTTRIGPSDMDSWFWSSINNFNQGFVAQFDTDASEFKTDGYELIESRVPGKLITDDVYTVSENLSIANGTTYDDGGLGGLQLLPAGVSVRKSASTTNKWTFERNGDLNTPTDGSIKLNQTQLGFATMYGKWRNYNDDVWYQSVTRDSEGNVYTLGSNNLGPSFAYVSKFAPTGERLWEQGIYTSEDAWFQISWTDNVYAVDYINNGGNGYRVGDRITIGGNEFGGDWANNLVLNVDAIQPNGDPNIGWITTVSIVSGVAPNGSGSGSYTDYRVNGEGDCADLTIDPKSGNLKLLITNLTYGGDSLDGAWTQTLMHTIDSDNGAVIDTTAFTDEGDVYGNSVSVDANGNWAVAGEKYNEYKELGALTPLTGSGLSKIAVAKSQFTSNYPGDADTPYGDTWIYGGDVLDQTYLANVNWYTGLTTTVRQGTGATFNVTAVAGSSSAVTLGGAMGSGPGHDYYGGGSGATRNGTAIYIIGKADSTEVGKLLQLNVGDTLTMTTNLSGPDTVTLASVFTASDAGGGLTAYSATSVESVAFSFIQDDITFNLVTPGTYTVAIPGTAPVSISTADLATAASYPSTYVTVNSDNIITPGGWDTWVRFPSGSSIATYMNATYTTNQVVPVTWGAGSTTINGYVIFNFAGDGSFDISPCPADVLTNPSGPSAGTWYFPVSFGSLPAVGSNYRVGHQILLQGSNLGGTDMSNNATVVVTSVNGSGGINGATISGSSTGSSTYTGVSGSNTNLASGYNLNMQFNPINGKPTGSWSVGNSYGSNYVNGDVITIAGTQFVGGTSPANDIVLTVSNTSNGEVSDLQFDTNTQHINADYLLLNTNDSTDFSSGSGYHAKQNLGGEAFVATANWAKAIGGASSDYFNSLAHDSDGHVIAVGGGRYDVNYLQGLVVKYNGSSGALMWSVATNPYTNDDAENTSVVVLSDDSIVVAGTYYDDNYGNNQLCVTKLNSAGEIQWQRGFYFDDDGWVWAPTIAVDPTTDEVVVTVVSYVNDGRIDGNNAWSIIKLDSDGEVLWKRVWGTCGNDTYQNYTERPGKAISISGDKFTIAGYTYATADDYANACSVTLPLDGSGTGQHGIWNYFEPQDSRFQQIRFDTTEQTISPNVNTANLVSDVPRKLYYSSWPNDRFNLFTEAIRNEDGGAIEFADGSKQTFSATTIPQVRIYGDYYLRPEDSGRHLYITQQNYTIYIPYWERVKLPVGYTITIVNRSGNTVYLSHEDGDNQGRMFFSGGSNETPYVGINDSGSGQVVTLLKVEEGEFTDADNHGDRWMIVGTNIYDNW